MRLLRHCGGGAARNPVGGGVCDSAAPSRSRRDYAVIYCARSQVNRIIPQLITRSSTIAQTALDGARGASEREAAAGLLPLSLYVTARTCFCSADPSKAPRKPPGRIHGLLDAAQAAAKSPLDSWGWFTPPAALLLVMVLLLALPRLKNRAKLSSRALALHTSAPGKVATSARPFRTCTPRARH